jgi:hypothetical protein
LTGLEGQRHFAHSVDLLDKVGEVIEQLAGVGDYYLGHKNIQHTVRYTELSPARFRDFWKD